MRRGAGRVPNVSRGGRISRSLAGFAPPFRPPGGPPRGWRRADHRSPGLLGYFERLVDPYPDNEPPPPPKGVFPFIWACSAGVRRFVLGMTLLTAVIGAFEALLFAVMGRVVDWLSHVEPTQLWDKERDKLLKRCSHTDTHTHAHALTHICTHTYIRTRVHTYTCMYTYTHT